VQRSGADIGLAFDGDADRVMAVDESGNLINGDRIISILATRLPRYRKQAGVVLTQMSNLGVETALTRRGIKVFRSSVGDSNVLQLMLEQDLLLGGEQSGHVIMRDRLPAGDGIGTGLQLCWVLAGQSQSLGALASEFEEYPQVLTNLRLKDLQGWRKTPSIKRKLKETMKLFPSVRFFLRESGTEPYVRVLTEDKHPEICHSANQAVCRILMEAER
jgi:phosphoglucosamine mutase